MLGGGLMGSGICTACILNGIDIILKEVNQQFLDVSQQHGPGPATPPSPITVLTLNTTTTSTSFCTLGNCLPHPHTH